MQRVVFQNSRHQNLVGHFYASKSDAVVVMAHGFCSDKLSRGRFPRIAAALQESGYAVLAFDFSGCGESDDERLTAEKQVDDLRAALAFVGSLGYARVALWGHSLGARICFGACQPEIVTMVLTGAGTGPMVYRWEDHFSADQLRELQETGKLTERRDEGPRREIVIEIQMLRDFEDVDQQTLLSRVACPVLLIHGDADEDEQALCELSQAGMQYLPAGSRLEVIPGADHTFEQHLERVIELGRAWLEGRMPVGGG